MSISDFISSPHSFLDFTYSNYRLLPTVRVETGSVARSRIKACTLAESPMVIRYIRGFSHFVTSMTAPIASGWSESCRVGFAPTEKTPPYHGARQQPERTYRGKVRQVNT